MPIQPSTKIANLRAGEEGIYSSFEEFCCQLFRRAREAPTGGVFRRIRGVGGDGGVEATWTCPDGRVWGLQAKFFKKLQQREKTKLSDSVRQASANYNSLQKYTICFPFNLTGKKGAISGKAKSGQHEAIAGWIHEWKSELAANGLSVEFDVWDESELLGRLAEGDLNGGLTRYWFSDEPLSGSWFDQRLREAIAQAGKRYSPKLRIGTPLDDAMQAFGCSAAWIEKIEKQIEIFTARLDAWRRIAQGSDHVFGASPPDLLDESRALLAAAEPLDKALALATEDQTVIRSGSFRSGVEVSVERGETLEPRMRGALLKRYGRAADTPGFRQFRAEYHADFPMAPLDDLVDLLAVLREIKHMAFQPDGELPAGKGMLIRGEAGIGKTHGIVDAAQRRSDVGLRSVVLFGEDFEGAEPWLVLASKLGLKSSEGWSSVLEALDAAGEASGFPLIIFVDALNETQPDRRKWQVWLPRMIEQLGSRRFLKLCLSCRDLYVEEVVPENLKIPTVVHNGFVGREYEAQFGFFQHFGLGVPAEPLLQTEFSNPLFLRLVCEALQSSGRRAVPVGRDGIRAVIDLLIEAKNERAAIACDYDRREDRVSKAMLALARAMAERSRRDLPLPVAKAIVDGPTTAQSTSLFHVLEGESLIATIEHRSTELGGPSQYFVRFTFERIAEHLIAEYLVSDSEDVGVGLGPGGPLHYLVKDNSVVHTNVGLLEALSIQLAETRDVELVDAVVGVDRNALWRPFLAGLQWRSPGKVSERTRQLLVEALGSRNTVAEAFEAILSLAARPDHPLNAAFLDQLLRPMPMLLRDPLLASLLENSYSGWSGDVISTSRVHQLIDAACRGTLKGLPDTVAVLWATALAWFCASPDRRIRDGATKRLVGIFRARPVAIVQLIRSFARIDDEYIPERVLVAGYGALVLNSSVVDVGYVATEVYRLYFADGQPPRNASLRDHGRLIIELAVELGAIPEGAEQDKYQPPYRSPWPMVLPTEEDVRAYGEDSKRFPQMKLDEEIGVAYGTDFARYVVEPNVINKFELDGTGLDLPGVLRWFLMRAVETGYPGPEDRCAEFDGQLLAKFGGGRGKPGWAERLGKKYYWIFLRQLIGQLSDHVSRKDWSGKTFLPSNDLQGLGVRDIDPTDLRMFAQDAPEDDRWFVPRSYVFSGRDEPEDDDEWAAKTDLPHVGETLVFSDDNGSLWHALDVSVFWQGKRIHRRDGSYRYVGRSIWTVTCEEGDIGRLKPAFSKGNFSSVFREPSDYRGYLGEYPERWPYRCDRTDPISFEVEGGGIRFEHTELRQSRGNDWEWDYSVVGGSTSLLMPSTALVGWGSLKWDGRGGWYDAKGVVQVLDPLWWSEKRSSLIVRLDYLDAFLKSEGKALVISGFQQKFIAGMGPKAAGRQVESTLFVRRKGRTDLVGRNNRSD